MSVGGACPVSGWLKCCQDCCSRSVFSHGGCGAREGCQGILSSAYCCSRVTSSTHTYTPAVTLHANSSEYNHTNIGIKTHSFWLHKLAFYMSVKDRPLTRDQDVTLLMKCGCGEGFDRTQFFKYLHINAEACSSVRRYGLDQDGTLRCASSRSSGSVCKGMNCFSFVPRLLEIIEGTAARQHPGDEVV